MKKNWLFGALILGGFVIWFFGFFEGFQKISEESFSTSSEEPFEAEMAMSGVGTRVDLAESNSKNEVVGVVTRVNSEFAFVVLELNQKAKVEPGAVCEIVRNGESLAEVRLTAGRFLMPESKSNHRATSQVEKELARVRSELAQDAAQENAQFLARIGVPEADLSKRMVVGDYFGETGEIIAGDVIRLHSPE